MLLLHCGFSYVFTNTCTYCIISSWPNLQRRLESQLSDLQRAHDKLKDKVAQLSNKVRKGAGACKGQSFRDKQVAQEGPCNQKRTWRAKDQTLS